MKKTSFIVVLFLLIWSPMWGQKLSKLAKSLKQNMPVTYKNIYNKLEKDRSNIRSVFIFNVNKECNNFGRLLVLANREVLQSNDDAKKIEIRKQILLTALNTWCENKNNYSEKDASKSPGDILLESWIAGKCTNSFVLLIFESKMKAMKALGNW